MLLFIVFSSQRTVVAMSMITVFLGKLLGLYLIAIAIAMLAGKKNVLTALDEMVASPAWMLFSGMVATAIGLAIVLAHQQWTGGALAVAVTLVGWIALIKGLSLLLVPATTMAKAYQRLGLERYFYLWSGLVFILGLWIAGAAFSG